MGGAVFVDSGNLVVVGGRFTSCTASAEKDGIAAGGGVAISSGTALFTQTSLVGLFAYADKAGNAAGGALAVMGAALVEFDASHISGSGSDKGCGVYIQLGLLTLNSSIVRDCNANFEGGGLAVGVVPPADQATNRQLELLRASLGGTLEYCYVNMIRVISLAPLPLPAFHLLIAGR